MSKNRDFIRLGLAFSGFIIFAMPVSMLGIAWPSIRATFGLPLKSLGILFFVGMVGHVVASVANGRLVARLDFGPVLLLSWLLLTAGVVGYATAPAWGWLLLAAALAGAGGGMLDAGQNTFVAREYGSREMNWLHACYGIGATVGPLVMTALITRGVAWQRGFALMAVLHIGMGLLFALSLRTWQSPADAPERQTHTSYRATLRQPVVWLGLLVFLLYVGLETSVGQWSFTLLTESRGIDAAVAGSWTSLFWGSLTLGRLLTGLVVQRLGDGRTLQLSMLGMLLGTILLAVPTPLTSLAGMLLSGFGAAAIFPLLTADTPRRTGRLHAANAVGFQLGASSLGITLIPGLAGWLAAGSGLEAIGPFLVFGAVLMAAVYAAMNSMSLRSSVVGA